MKKVIMKKRIGLFYLILLIIISNNLLFGQQYKAPEYFKDKNILKLIKYIKYGNMNKAKELMNNGVNIDTTSDYYTTPIYFFFLNHNYPAFKRILELGASPDVYPTGQGSFSLINYSMDIHDSRYFKLLLKYDVKLNYKQTKRNGQRPLYFSFYPSVNKKNLKMLLEHGVDLSNDMWENSPVLEALRSSEYLKVILLLEYGADFNNNENIKQLFIKNLESEYYIQGKNSGKLREQKKLVKYLKDRFDIDIQLYASNGR